MLGYLVSLLITLAVLIAVSLISYRWIEKKGFALGEKIINTSSHDARQGRNNG